MENESKFCPKCGTKVKAEAKFCPKCGNPFVKVTGSPESEESERLATQPLRSTGKKSLRHRNWLITGIITAVLLVVTITIAGSIITKQQTQAKKAAMIQSSQLKESIKKKKQAKENRIEKQLAHESVDVVTDMIQNDWDLDAECDDVTITSSYGGNQYGGYASVSDDDGDQTTVDVTVTNVKYDHNVSVEIDGDGHDTLDNTFNTYDDEDDVDDY